MTTVTVRIPLGFLAVLLALAGTAVQAATVTFNGIANSVNRGGAATGFYSLTVDTHAIA